MLLRSNQSSRDRVLSKYAILMTRLLFAKRCGARGLVLKLMPPKQGLISLSWFCGKLEA